MLYLCHWSSVRLWRKRRVMEREKRLERRTEYCIICVHWPGTL